MATLEQLRERLPDFARDAKLNLQTVLQQSSLSTDQRWGVVVASAIASRNPELLEAILDEARAAVGAEVIDDAFAAASLMAMNNVFYRFRHMIGKETYTAMPARLRMQRIAKPASNKADFELICLAVSAINGCEMCMRSHEAVVLEAGIGEAAVLDAVRIAAVVNAAAVSLEIPALQPAAV